MWAALSAGMVWGQVSLAAARKAVPVQERRSVLANPASTRAFFPVKVVKGLVVLLCLVSLDSCDLLDLLDSERCLFPPPGKP